MYKISSLFGKQLWHFNVKIEVPPRLMETLCVGLKI